MALFDLYFPPISGISERWKHWLSIKDLRRCVACQEMHGQIYFLDEIPEQEPPLHVRCRCEIETMEVVQPGNATKDGQNGADWWIEKHGTLPEYYITMEDIESLGWRRGKSPSKFCRIK